MNLPILELWYAALREPIGIIVACSNADKMKAQLYKARKDSADPELQRLMVHTSPRNHSGEVWITHRHIDVTREDIRKAIEDGQGQ